MTIAFTALLYLEIMGKPTLRAQPGSVMTRGMQLTISCEGTSSAQEYYLYKEGSPDPWRRQSPLEHGNKAEFFFPSFHPNEAGRYRCYYRTHTGWSERSDFLDLMVTGFYRKPSLSARPSPVVRFGKNVTLECISQLGYDGFSLTKEEQQKISWTLDSQYIYSKNNVRALFSVGPLTSGHRRTFRCYGYYLDKPQVWSEPSDPLELLVSVCVVGVPIWTGHTKPSYFCFDQLWIFIIILICRNRCFFDEETQKCLRPPANHKTCQKPQ
ncbi:leukocyte immunoglobulin-like receptor subfamily A member 5 isoform X3 [Microtus pennsylvanicus]|uniref:leukocyte immunoglobulin-like receptor subfamily A member 5 isoform X3 n=1 Tax=Microtus pennsylvanicus TaxID=10058 RepID=UPI003F6CB6B9